MLRAAERYKRAHPEVLVHLQVEKTRACCAAVAAGEANIAIVGGEVPRELEHLVQVRGAPRSPQERGSKAHMQQHKTPQLSGCLVVLGIQSKHVKGCQIVFRQ